MPEIFGLGIEHECMVMKESGDRIERVQRPTEAGGYRSESIVFTNRNRIVNLSRGTRDRREVGLVSVATDPTVDDYLSGYELGTMGWKFGTVEKQLNKLRGAEKLIIEKARERHPGSWVGIFPFGTYGAQNNAATGSYHFTITFPLDSAAGETAAYRQKLKEFVAHFQWIEPLMFAMTGGASPLSVGDAGEEPEGSIRLGRNSYGNPGGTNPQALARGTLGRHSGEHVNWQSYIKIAHPKFSTDADISTSGHSSTAIEIRVFDQFSSDGLKSFLKTIFYTASNAIDRNLTTPARAGVDEDWNRAMARVVEEGWNAYLPKSYVEKIKRNLKLDIDTEGSLRAIDVMRQVEKELWEKNKEGNISKTFIEDRNQPPKIHEFNRDAWNYFLKRNLRTNLPLKNKFLRFVGVLSDADKAASQGWIHIGTEARAGVRNVVNEKLGDEYSAEDSRDIIDFLELIGAISTKRRNDGSIEQVKLNFEGNELKDKVKMAIENKDFYQTLEGIEPIELERMRTDNSISPAQEAAIQRGVGRGVRMVGRRVRLRGNYPDEQLSSQFRVIRDNQTVGEIIATRTGYRTRPTESLIDIRFPGIESTVTAPFNALEIVEITSTGVEFTMVPRPVESPVETGVSTASYRSVTIEGNTFEIGDIVRNGTQEGTVSRVDVGRNQLIVRRPDGRYTRWGYRTVSMVRRRNVSGGKYSYRPRRGPGWYSTRRGRIAPVEVKRHVIAGRKGALKQGLKLRKKKIRTTRKVGDFEL